LEAAVMKTEISPTGNRSKTELAAPRGCYRCKGTDRWCAIAACNEEQWQALCHVLGSPGWIEDRRFTTLSGRIKYARQLDELIEQKTAKRSVPELVQLLQSAGVPAAAAQDAEDLANDPHLSARDFFVHLPHPALGDTVLDGSPIKLRRTAAQDWKAAPALGADNRYVYLDLLGLTEAEFRSYVRKKIIA
jgi:crotonobetainyl-CoA:carnitine CoA-transferase CaiB-like acyl-CoA transferase